MVKARIVYFAAAFLIALASCSSSPTAERRAAPGTAAHMDWLRGLAETEPGRALTICHAMDPSIRRSAEGAWEAVVKAAVERLSRTLGEAVAASDWKRAWEASLNLSFLAERGSLFPEASGVVDAALLAEWPQARILRSWAQAAERSGALSLSSMLRSLAGEEGTAAPPASSISQMLPGVCTIWVNRGLKSEGGLAVADRVIGSGFFIDREGFLITNYHVIESEVDPAYEGYSRLFVRMPSDPDERVPAKVLGWDRTIDIALLKTAIKPDYVFSLESRREFRPGDRVYAIGSPLGLASTVNAGIVSAVDRDILPMARAIQIDVAVNPGNSGGPLLDETGRMAGVIFAGLAGYQGLNFAIGAHTVYGRLPALFSGGESARGLAGISVAQVQGRVEVLYVIPGSAAAEAGVAEGDILLAVDGKPVKDAAAARSLCAQADAGRLLLLGTERAGGKIDRLLDMRKRPWLPAEPFLRKDSRQRLLPLLFGMKVERVRRSVLEDGYSVTAVVPGSPADEMGLSEGDPIAIKGWIVDKEQEAVFIQMYVKRRKQGFLEAIIQMGASYALLPFI